MTEKSEKCFIPVVLNKLKTPFIMGVLIILGCLLIYATFLAGNYLEGWFESSGVIVTLSKAINGFGDWAFQNNLIIFIGFIVLWVILAAHYLKKGYKNSGYSILALILMPLIVCYLTIRSLFWFHILIINGHDVLYESTPGLSFCIVCSIGLVLAAVWFAFAEGITTCYKDEVE